jgi:hypothetical protein
MTQITVLGVLGNKPLATRSNPRHYRKVGVDDRKVKRYLKLTAQAFLKLSAQDFEIGSPPNHPAKTIRRRLVTST